MQQGTVEAIEAREQELAQQRPAARETQTVRMLFPRTRAAQAKFSLPAEPIKLRYAEGSTMAWDAMDKFLDEPIKNESTGLVASISRSTRKKILHKDTVAGSVSPQAHMLAAANLDKLFRIAVPREEPRPDRYGNDQIKAWHHFDAPMPFAGDVLRVKILAKEMAQAQQGVRIYQVQAVEIEKPASSPGISTSLNESAAPMSTKSAGFSWEFNTLAEHVKRGEAFSDSWDEPGPTESLEKRKAPRSVSSAPIAEPSEEDSSSTLNINIAPATENVNAPAPTESQAEGKAKLSLPSRRGRSDSGEAPAKFSLPAEPIKLRYAEGSTMAWDAIKSFFGVPLTNAETGLVATVSRNSAEELLAPSHIRNSISPQAHMLAVANLDKLFPIAIRRESRPGKKKGDVEIRKIHHFIVPMPFRDDVVMVKIMAKEFRRPEQGSRLYLVSAVEIEKELASYGAESTSSDILTTPLSSPARELQDKFNTLLAAVKRGEVFSDSWDEGPAPAKSQAEGKAKLSLTGAQGMRRLGRDPAGAERLSSAWRDRGLFVFRAAENALKYWPAGGRPAEDIIGTIPEGQEYLQRVERAWWETRRRLTTWTRHLKSRLYD